MQIKSIGIDLGKITFHLVALGSSSQVVVRKKFSRQQLLLYTANLPSSLMGMEAGVGSHFLGRALREQGHEVRLIPAQFVRPFVKSNKNDYCDAEAIAEAVERQNMRFVPSRRRANSTCKLCIGYEAAGLKTHQRHQSDSGFPVGARDQLSERAGQPAPANAGDSGERRRETDGSHAPPVGFSLAGVETFAAADREFERGSREGREQRRSLPSTPADPWGGSPGGHGRSIGHRERGRLPQGTRVCGLAGPGTGAMVNRRQGEAAGDQ